MANRIPASTLRAAFDAGGQVTAITPDHPLYERARRGQNELFDPHPALIVRCRSSADVRAAIDLGRREGLEIAVRGGGHSVAGFCSVDDGLVIDLSAMRRVEIDSAARIATVGGGATAGDLDGAGHAFGLATPMATVSTVGAAGFTLGGGIGYLARAYGLAADSLVGAEVVLADGSVVQTSEARESELLWALRGGGGNFGVVTELRFRLHPVRAVAGGPMFWPVEETERILDLYLRWLPEQPPDVYAFLAVMSIPPAGPFPPELHLRKVCALVWCNIAPGDRSDAALSVFRRECTPLVDAVGEMPYPALQAAFDGIAALGSRSYISGQCYAALPAAAAVELMRFGETAPTWLSFTHLYPIDGAAARPAADTAAWPWRDAAFAQMFLAASHEPGQDDELAQWSRDFSAALAPHGLGGTYSNFLMDEGPGPARAAYGRNYGRLATIKGRYDPENLFRANVNVEPAGSAS